MKCVLILLLLIGLVGLVLPYLRFRQPPMPPGTDVAGPLAAADAVVLLIDRTSWVEGRAEPRREHAIFEEILAMIDRAENFLLLDFFLWNPWKGALESGASLRPLSAELADALLRKRATHPELPILVVTDPINRAYGAHAPGFYDRLADAGIPVVFTDLERLPDSNLVYAPLVRFWKPWLRWLKALPGVGRSGSPNPFDPHGRRLTPGETARLLRFKANHRKVVVAGQPDGGVEVLVASLNPADGSANHSNLGLRVAGPVAVDAARSELEVVAWSLVGVRQPVHGGHKEAVKASVKSIEARLAEAEITSAAATGDAPLVAWRGEEAIRREIVRQLGRAGPGATVSAAVFYLSDRTVVRALKDAARRGAKVRLILDANRDAFGREKNGVPNRPVAAELMRLADKHDIAVRWAATNGEQFHAKALRVRGGDGDPDSLLLGSANWTRRNIANFNLEANLLVERAGETGIAFDRYFESVWTNDAGATETLPYRAAAETGFPLLWKSVLYRIQEASGASTF